VRTECDESLIISFVDALDALELERPLLLREGDGRGVVDGLAGSLELLQEHLADDDVVLVLEIDGKNKGNVVALPLQVESLIVAVVECNDGREARLAIEHGLQRCRYHGALEEANLARQIVWETSENCGFLKSRKGSCTVPLSGALSRSNWRV